MKNNSRKHLHGDAAASSFQRTLESILRRFRQVKLDSSVRWNDGADGHGKKSLELRGVTIMQRGVAVIRDISLTVQAGELLQIQGASGSGKSLLLKVISGTLNASHGEIRLRGERLIRKVRKNTLLIDNKEKISSIISVSQQVRRWARSAAHPELADAALHYFDLTRFAKQPARTLSDGCRQRLRLTQLILNPHRIWLLDEPFTYLDEEGASLLHALIQTRLEQGGIVLLVSQTHALDGAHVHCLNLDEKRDSRIRENTL